MNNADLIAKTLEAAGVRWVFGIPSGPVLPLIEALRKTSVEYVLVANEASAGFMATTVGALTRIPGVCAATLGPGATNMTTGVGAAWLDRAPLIAITCNVGTAWLDRRIQMRIDHHALYAPLTKGTFPLRSGSVTQTLSEALTLACTEPPGPVHLDLPEDVATAVASPPVGRPSQLQHRKVPPPTAAVVTALAQSRRPLLITGLTLTRSHAAPELLRFIEHQQIPFISTLHAKGVLPESHPNWCGVLGRARRSDIQRFVKKADLIIAVGYDPIESNYEEWVGSSPVVHISTEPAEGFSALVNWGGDLDEAIREMAGLPVTPNDWSPRHWADHRALLETNLRPKTNGFAAHEALDVLRDILPPDAILAYDVGAHTHQIATQWRTDLPQTALSTNGWSSMGFGMPAAYAAKMVHPDRTVVAVVGDGCFQMTAGELALARRRNLPVPIIVLNDGWLGLMKVKQQHWEYPFYGVELGEPPPTPEHYFGVPARSAKDSASFRVALGWALAHNGPTVVEAFIDVESYSTTVFD